jgi:hypothetical protein
LALVEQLEVKAQHLHLQQLIQKAAALEMVQAQELLVMGVLVAVA